MLLGNGNLRHADVGWQFGKSSQRGELLHSLLSSITKTVWWSKIIFSEKQGSNHQIMFFLFFSFVSSLSFWNWKCNDRSQNLDFATFAPADSVYLSSLLFNHTCSSLPQFGKYWDVKSLRCIIGGQSYFCVWCRQTDRRRGKGETAVSLCRCMFSVSTAVTEARWENTS